MKDLSTQRAAGEASEFEDRLATRSDARDIRFSAPQEQSMRGHSRRQSTGQAPARTTDHQERYSDAQECQFSNHLGQSQGPELQSARDSRDRYRDRAFEQDRNA